MLLVKNLCNMGPSGGGFVIALGGDDCWILAKNYGYHLPWLSRPVAKAGE
jgi:hypothetical protein